MVSQHWLLPIVRRIAGWPWEGRRTQIETSPAMTDALGGAIMRATAEAVEHPGLYQAYYADAPTIQLTMRPGWSIEPDELAELMWLPADEMRHPNA